ncbi:MAG: methyltransferase domain-containing protein [Cyanobacteria bacterium TGS_CYA1]|nr:methyltransferase domain-containing protein [Cyanobacteria bacterium TGS_CYA1]
MTEPLDNHYTSARLAEIYDLDSGWSEDREFYLNLAGTTPKRILDLGCGTGLLCDAYAASGHKVTGVDPAEAMLDVARKKPHAKDIEWILSTAQDFKSSHLFDLIIMTGHAFQVLLTDRDVITVFKMMKEHLHPDGLIVFESRNPLYDWKKEWNYEIPLDTTSGIVTESRKLENFENNLMTFTLNYEFPSDILTSTSVLKFWTKAEIEQNLASANLAIEKISGTWEDAPFEPSSSKEMIFWVHNRS